MVKYTYDAWGNHEVSGLNGVIITDMSHIGNLNPFRYRSYYYDTDTKLYCLKTRYYDPEAGRFISQDGIEYLDPETINGLNLYAYCANNPVMNVDPTGRAFLAFAIAALVGLVVSFGISAGSQAALNNGKVEWGQALVDGLFGAVSGALWMIPGIGPVAMGFINAGLTAVNGIITTGMENHWEFEWQDGVSIAVSSILSGFVASFSRLHFFNIGGQKILTNANKFIETVGNRIASGAYNNGVDIFSKAFRSATSQMIRLLADLNFGKGFYKDLLISAAMAIFSNSFSKGLKSLIW